MAASIAFNTLKLDGIDSIDFGDRVQVDFKNSVANFAGVDFGDVQIHRMRRGSVILSFSVAFRDVIGNSDSGVRFQRYREVMTSSPAAILIGANTTELQKIVNLTNLDQRFEDQQAPTSGGSGESNYWIYIYAFVFANICILGLYVMPTFGVNMTCVETIFHKLGLENYVSIYTEMPYLRPLLTKWDVCNMVLCIFDFGSDLQFANISTRCSSTYQTAAFSLIGISMTINLLVIMCTIGYLRGKLVDSDVLTKLPLVYWPVIFLALTSTNHLKSLPWTHRTEEWEEKASLRESFPVRSFPKDHCMPERVSTCWSTPLFGLRCLIIWATVIFEDIPQIILVIHWNVHGVNSRCPGARDWASVESLVLSGVNIAVAVLANAGNTCGRQDNKVADLARKYSEQRREKETPSGEYN